ncbi:MAG: hypothetical protein ACRD29_24280 [Acidimicrobiales bacterium]
MPRRLDRYVRGRLGAYALGVAFARWAPDARFVVVCLPRSGSTLLVELLDSVPRLRCENEVLKAPMRWPARFVTGRAALAGHRGAVAYGFKLIEYQAPVRQGMSIGAIARDLVDDGWRLVHLRRRNVLRLALSHYRARATGRWHLRRADRSPVGPFRVDPEGLLAATYLTEEADARTSTELAGLGGLELTYEDDLLDRTRQQATVDHVCDHLGIPSGQATSSLARIGDPALADAIANYDEVAALVQATRYRCWLDDG